jgi:hypothetical protein
MLFSKKRVIKLSFSNRKFSTKILAYVYKYINKGKEHVLNF